MASELDALREHCADARSRPARAREGRVTAVFSLRAGVDYTWLAEFIERHEISEEEYGLVFAVSTSFPSGVVRAPAFAAKLHRKVGGVLDFSFTVLTEEWDEVLEKPET